jgi:CRP/FNR family transcriptional activator FtrB
MRPSDRNAIRKLRLFEQASDESFAALCQGALVQTFPPHVELVREGELPDFLHVLLDGTIQLFSLRHDRETTLGLVQPGASFIVAAVATEAPYLMSARTLTPCRILLMPALTVRMWLAEDAGFARAVVEELSWRYRELVGELKGHKQRSAPQRLAHWILAADAQLGGAGRFRLPFEKRVLASHLGMTPENLSRAFVALGDYGVRVSGRDVCIIDGETLLGLLENGRRSTLQRRSGA